MSIVNNIENTENLMSELVTPVGAEIKVEVISPEEMDDDDFEPGGKYPSEEYERYLRYLLQKAQKENWGEHAIIRLDALLNKHRIELETNPFWFNAMNMVYMGMESLLDEYTLKQCKMLMAGPYSEIYEVFANRFMKEK